MIVILMEAQAKHLRSLEVDHGVGASELVGKMELAGAHTLHHSVIGGWVTLICFLLPSSPFLFPPA